MCGVNECSKDIFFIILPIITLKKTKICSARALRPKERYKETIARSIVLREINKQIRFSYKIVWFHVKHTHTHTHTRTYTKQRSHTYPLSIIRMKNMKNYLSHPMRRKTKEECVQNTHVVICYTLATWSQHKSSACSIAYRIKVSSVFFFFTI